VEQRPLDDVANINEKERKIIKIFLKDPSKGYSTYMISKLTGMSWTSAKKYLERLEKKGLVRSAPVLTSCFMLDFKYTKPDRMWYLEGDVDGNN